MKSTTTKKSVIDTISQFYKLCLEHDIESLKAFATTPEYEKHIRLEELYSVNDMVINDYWKKNHNTAEGKRISVYELPIILYLDSITKEYYKKIDEALEYNNMPFLKDRFPELVQRQTKKSKNDIYYFEQFLNKSLVKAAKNGYTEMVKFLTTSPDLPLHAKIDHNKNECFLEACNAGHIDIIRFLISSSKLEKPIQVYQTHLSYEGSQESKEYLRSYNKNLTVEYNKLTEFKTKCINLEPESFINEVIQYLDKPIFKEFETLYQKFVEELFFEGCKIGKSKLVDFFLEDKRLTFHATNKFKEGFEEVCKSNQSHLIENFEKHKIFITDRTYFANIGIQTALKYNSFSVVKTLSSSSFMSESFFYFSRDNFTIACENCDMDSLNHFINTPKILGRIIDLYPYENEIISVIKGDWYHSEAEKIKVLDLLFNNEKLKPKIDHYLYKFQKEKLEKFDYVNVFFLASDNKYNDIVEYFLNDKNLSTKFSLLKNAEAITLKALNNKNHTLLNNLVCNYAWRKTENISEQIAINQESTNIAVQEFAKYADNLFSMAQLNSKLYALTENKDLENKNMGKKKI